MQHRSTLMLSWLALGIGYGGDFASLWIILDRFGGIAGWRWEEMALLLGFHTLGYALGASFTFVQLRDMEDLLGNGGFDALLIRPMNTWLYIVSSGFNIEYVSHILLGAALISWALPNVITQWNVFTVPQLIISLISAGLLTASIFTIIGACALLFRRSRYIFSIYFDFWELARYPATIFAVPLGIVLFTVMPLAYMAYVPVASLLGKPVPYLGSAAPLIAIGVGPVAVMLAMRFWQFALHRYQTG